MEEWASIQEFPDYSVSTIGRVRNDRSGKILVLSTNQQGIVKVGFFVQGKHTSRAVGPLVAKAFIPDHAAHFDTVIHLDNDPSNNDVSNLMWRPRWFAVKYFLQFKQGLTGHTSEIRNKETGERFANSRDAVIKNGLLEKELILSILNHTYVTPTFQEFEFVVD